LRYHGVVVAAPFGISLTDVRSYAIALKMLLREVMVFVGPEAWHPLSLPGR